MCRRRRVEQTSVSDFKQALELIFNLDEAHVYFKNEAGRKHRVFLVMGNSPEEVTADWSYAKDDATGFNAAMDVFKAEDHL